MRSSFMGTPEYAVPTLTEIVSAGHDVVAVYTRAPKPAGRGQAERNSPVHLAAEGFGIPVHTPRTLRDEAEQIAFAALEADVGGVVAYGLILPKPILDAPAMGCLNLHGSLLPRWRGAAPIQRAIMAGDAETGVLSMRMEAGLDPGPKIMAERTPIGRKTYGELHDELARLGADLMARTMGALERGTATETPQPDEGVTYAKKIEKEEARIDWTKSAREIDCHIRGLSPFPGAWSELKGERIKILNCEPATGSGPPGTVLDDALTIACGEGAIRLTRLQRPVKAAMNATDLLRGFAVPRGAQFV